MQKQKAKAALSAAFPHTVPVLTGFALLGIAYGLLMRQQGHSPIWALLMSAVCFCGSMQFAAVPLLLSPFRPLEAFMLALLVNARHIFYGISMLSKYKGLGRARIFLIFALCDETFSINCSVEPPETVDRKLFYLFITLLNYLYWFTGTFVGGVVGGMLTTTIPGLDFVLTALFIVLLMEQLRTASNRIPAAIGIGCTVMSLLLFGPDNLVIPAMAMIAAALLIGRRWLSCT